MCVFGWGGVFKVIIPVSKTTLTASWQQQQQQEDKKTERPTRGGRKLHGRQTDRGSVKKPERDGEKRGSPEAH